MFIYFQLYEKINKETGLSKEQVKSMELKQLNSYFKSQNFSKDIISDIREQSYMTSDVLGGFLTYLPTLIKWFTT